MTGRRFIRRADKALTLAVGVVLGAGLALLAVGMLAEVWL